MKQRIALWAFDQVAAFASAEPFLWRLYCKNRGGMFLPVPVRVTLWLLVYLSPSLPRPVRVMLWFMLHPEGLTK